MKTVSALETPAAQTPALHPDPPRERAAERPPSKGPGIRVLLLGVAAGFVAGGLITRCVSFWPGVSVSSSRQESSSRQLPSDLPVVALGRLEPEGGVIQIGGPPGDRLSRILVKEGEDVEEGQELVYLQSYSDRLAEKNLADSQLQEAIARREALKESGEMLVEQARIRITQINKEYPFVEKSLEAKVRLLKAQLETANKEMARLKASSPDAVSPQQLNLQHFAVRQAEEELIAAQASRDKMQTEQPLNLQAAQTQLRIAQADLARSQLQGPIDSLKQAVAVAQSRYQHSIIQAPRRPGPQGAWASRRDLCRSHSPARQHPGNAGDRRGL